MIKYYTLFVKKKITFKGDEEEQRLYREGTGYPTEIENNITTIINEFEKYCKNNEKDKHYMVSIIGKTKTLALLSNPENKHNPYMMIYDLQTNNRMYSVCIKDIDKLKGKVAKQIIDYIPRMCEFTENQLEKQQSKDVWMFDNLQNFADAIDKSEIEL